MTRDPSLEGTLLVQDVALLLASLVLARLLHVGTVRLIPGLKPPVAPAEYLHLLIVFLPIWVFAAERMGIHRLRTLTGARSEMVRRVLMTQGCGLAAVALIVFAAQAPLNRSLVAIFFLLSTVVLLVASAAQARMVTRRRGRSLVLLVGDVDDAVAAEIERTRGLRVERQGSRDLAVLASALRRGPVDEIVLAGGLSPEQTRTLLEFCAEVGIPALLPIRGGPGGPADVVFPPPQVESVAGTQFLVYQRRNVDTLSLVLKALQDRIGALLMLLILSPLLLVLALLVPLFVGGSALYIQLRGGLFGHPFSMLKFRTMRPGADKDRDALMPLNEMDGPAFKMTNDPRVTRFGRFLRRTSLDELPQLLNVLAGQMSLVGPRPLPLQETEALQRGYRRRLSMRPGLTCLWQVSGRSDLRFDEWMSLDLDYVDRWSLGLDLAILLRTVPAILSGRGAR